MGFGWFGPGLSLATLYSLRHCLGVFCLDAPSARCLLLVVLCATVVKLESRKNMPKAFAWPSMLGCTSYFWWYNVVLFYRSLIYFQRGKGYQFRRRIKQAQSVPALLHERRVGD